MHGTIPPLPNTPSWHGAQLKHRGNFTFTLTSYIRVHSNLHISVSYSIIKHLSLCVLYLGRDQRKSTFL